ncbi:hypothetical protein H0H92_012074 [Tricholoma furcatifolium]|nr:hypothetical protein H0H92_012074 [Tricholoma furcatifolium]
MSARNVYLVSVPLRNARPHWAIWIPVNSNSPNAVGKKIHAVGAPQSGFEIVVEHAFDWSSDADKTHLFLLGTTDASNIIDIAEPTRTTSLNKDDKFEKVASTVSAVVAALQRDIPGMRRCQEWTMDYIKALVKAGLLPDDAIVVVAEARKLNPFPPQAAN